jgi:hypothetical protein
MRERKADGFDDVELHADVVADADLDGAGDVFGLGSAGVSVALEDGVHTAGVAADHHPAR